MEASSDLTPVQLAAYRAMDTPILTMLAMNSLAASQDYQLDSSAASYLEGASSAYGAN